MDGSEGCRKKFRYSPRPPCIHGKKGHGSFRVPARERSSQRKLCSCRDERTSGKGEPLRKVHVLRRQLGKSSSRQHHQSWDFSRRSSSEGSNRLESKDGRSAKWTIRCRSGI